MTTALILRALYDDRLEIYNPGGLYSPLTKEPGQDADNLRNPTLASVLETMHIMENKSSGIPLIRTEMQKLGLSEPVFKDEGSMFTVILYNTRHKGKRMR
ncbi:MAG: hypothetical protein LUD51_06975 [Clostridia bacterium]|nr:hypothetical protein [Clostridia bacterium]